MKVNLCIIFSLISFAFSSAESSADNESLSYISEIVFNNQNTLFKDVVSVESRHEPESEVVIKEALIDEEYSVRMIGESVIEIVDFDTIVVQGSSISKNEDYCQISRKVGVLDLLLDVKDNEPLKLHGNVENLEVEFVFTSRRLPYNVYFKYGLPEKMDLSLCGETLKSIRATRVKLE